MCEATYGQRGVFFARLTPRNSAQTYDRKYDSNEMSISGITLQTVMRGAAALVPLARPRFQASFFSTIERSAQRVGRSFRQAIRLGSKVHV
ncbi:hypothetical protein BG454_18285 [Roseinatronobacter bogoriensis subsp. barguzinensis]|uniref:Uncharacterized protein n=1 Tax=Roseinatronobacter bogoriensis subsp. barguzinensis TaxID=441209 RepID=A0A2K8KDM1_9RHOB|nr:hypothetical protein BG454_18285 [Rhodobaca barguzinensis]